MEPDRGQVLLSIARGAIDHALNLRDYLRPEGEWLREMGATFVTLRLDGTLRGCIGSTEADRPLGEDVEVNAVAAAFQDPRFPPVTVEEVSYIKVEVSKLTSPDEIYAKTEEDALAAIQPGVDGVIFECDRRRSTFLPQVWESLPEPARFLGELKRKAGFDPTFWSPKIRLWRYRVQKWSETDFETTQEP